MAEADADTTAVVRRKAEGSEAASRASPSEAGATAGRTEASASAGSPASSSAAAASTAGAVAGPGEAAALDRELADLEADLDEGSAASSLPSADGPPPPPPADRGLGALSEGLPLTAYAGKYEALVGFDPGEVALVADAEVEVGPKAGGLLACLGGGRPKRRPCWLALQGSCLFSFESRASTEPYFVYVLDDFQFLDATAASPGGAVPTLEIVHGKKLYHQRFFFADPAAVALWVRTLTESSNARWKKVIAHEKQLAAESRAELAAKAAACAELEGVVGALTSELPLKEGEIAALSRKVHELHESGDTSLRAMDSARARFSESAVENRALRASLEEKEALLETRGDKILDLEERNTILQLEQAELLDKVKQQEAEHEDLGGRFAELLEESGQDKAQLAELQEDLDRSTATIHLQEADLEDRKADVIRGLERVRIQEDQMAAFKAKVGELESRFLQSQVSEAKLKTSLEISLQEIAAMRVFRDVAVRKRDEADARSVQARGAAQAAAAETDKQRTLADRLHTAKAELEAEHHSAQLRQGELEAEVRALKDRVHVLNARVVDYTDQIEGLQGVVKEKDDLAQKSLATLKAGHATNAELQGRLRLVEQQCNDYQNQHRALAEEVKILQLQGGDKDREIRRLQARLQAFDRHSIQQDEERSALRQDVSTYQHKMDTYEAQLTSRAAEVSQVTSKLNEALRDRNSLLDENTRLKKLMENRAVVLDAQADLAAQKGPAPGAGAARGVGDTALAAEVARKDEVIRLLERNLASMQKVHSASQGAPH